MKHLGGIVLSLLLWCSAALAANCTLSGTVLNIDGTPCANCTITLNPVTQQPLTTGGQTYSSQPVSTQTDAAGVMTAVTLPQGLIVMVSGQTQYGSTWGGYSAIVPFMSSATFTQMNQGISTLPLNALASSQPPTGPLSMNNQKITTLACPSADGDALVWGCDATISTLTVSGTYNIGSGLAVTGRLTDSPIPDTTAPTVTPIGTTGATTYNYYVVCHDGNHGATNVSPAGSTAIGNATLTSTNYNHITWTMPAGGVTCDVLRNDTTHSIVTGLAGTVWNDQQATAGTAYLPPFRNTTGLMSYAETSTGNPGFVPTTLYTNIDGTYKTPSWGPSALHVWMSGGGGGGGGATSGGTNTAGAGGGAGALSDCYIINPTGTYTITVGTQGFGGTCAASPVAGTDGGNTTFGPSFCTAGGGVHGDTDAAGAGTGGAPSSATTGSDQTAQLMTTTAGRNGTTGINSVPTAGVGGNGPGSNGGTGATVSATTCATQSTDGNRGWVLIEAIP